jgi:hypothetical protein
MRSAFQTQWTCFRPPDSPPDRCGAKPIWFGSRENPGAASKPTPHAPDGHPDLNGVWHPEASDTYNGDSAGTLGRRHAFRRRDPLGGRGSRGAPAAGPLPDADAAAGWVGRGGSLRRSRCRPLREYGPSRQHALARSGVQPDKTPPKTPTNRAQPDVTEVR